MENPLDEELFSSESKPLVYCLFPATILCLVFILVVGSQLYPRYNIRPFVGISVAVFAGWSIFAFQTYLRTTEIWLCFIVGVLTLLTTAFSYRFIFTESYQATWATFLPIIVTYSTAAISWFAFRKLPLFQYTKKVKVLTSSQRGWRLFGRIILSMFVGGFMVEVAHITQSQANIPQVGNATPLFSLLFYFALTFGGKHYRYSGLES